jgi:hypothetical protein
MSDSTPWQTADWPRVAVCGHLRAREARYS